MKRIDEKVLQELQKKAADSPRKRTNLNLHQTLEDPVQRFLNAIEPGSYVRPHRHNTPLRWELFIALSGGAVVLIFDQEGEVIERTEIAAGGPTQAVEIPAGTWHTIAALRPGTVLIEFKQGSYAPLSEMDFASWAPCEGEAGCDELERWFHHAQAGSSFGEPTEQQQKIHGEL